MNKVKKRILSFISLLIAFSTFTCLTVNADTYYTEGDYKYKYLTEDTIMLSDYFGDSNVLTIPDTFLDRKVISVEPNAFYQNTQIEYINFGKYFTTVSAMGFSASGLKELILPSSMEKLVWSAFSDCAELTTVTITDSALTTIPKTCFYNCPKLSTVNLGNNITTIEQFAFSDCTSLTSITIPKATTTIASNAFRNCTNLTIYGYADSYAQQYATENNITFVVIPEYEIGDVDLSGRVDVKDATLIQSYIASLTTLTDEQLAVADVNGDSTINVLDATAVQRSLVGM